jgi:hypothetical protein
VDGSLQKSIDRIIEKHPAAKIELLPGDYRLAQPLRFTAKHSGMTLLGTSGAVIRGSVHLSRWEPVPNTAGLWKAKLPTPLPPSLQPRVIFCDDLWLSRARTPNTGWIETEEKLTTTAPLVMTIPAEHWRSSWEDQPGLKLRAVQKWAGFEQQVIGVDHETHRITLPLPAIAHRQEKMNRFWFENTKEDIDLPGEWAYLHSSSEIVWKPTRAANSAADVPAVDVPVVDSLVILDGAEGISLDGLTFRECGTQFPEMGEIDVQAAARRRGAIQFRASKNCRLNNCTVSDVAGYAVDIQAGSRDISVSLCKFSQLGAGGVRIGELNVSPEADKQVVGNEVDNCQISGYGRLDFGAVGLIVFQSSENRLSDNTISDAPYSGISVGWTWGYKDSPCHHNIVEHNHIHHLGSELLSDMGGVYLLGPQPGTIVRKNLIHDLKCHEYGAWGLYTDEGSTGILLEENVVARCMKAGFHQHYGKDNIIRRNLIVDCGEGGVRRSREEDHNSFTFEQNVVVDATGHFLHSNWKNRNAVLRKNLYFSNASRPWKWGTWTWDEWQGLGFDKDSLLADPLLEDRSQPQKGFQTDSPVYRDLGWWPDRFQPNPMSNVGPRPVFAVPASE